ncbi:hypothetical protein E2C01_019641 [Portunus trituberculatus]|uniref:Uncharacterized protein n=1 Tax=Portunus trituberculatus TaxID=210409 RepID=A0A5B7DXT1_PORTR|nr:hypothetical protein [Portunus trituberculatus]
MLSLPHAVTSQITQSHAKKRQGLLACLQVIRHLPWTEDRLKAHAANTITTTTTTTTTVFLQALTPHTASTTADATPTPCHHWSYPCWLVWQSLYLLLGPVHHRGSLPHVGALGAVLGRRGRLGVGEGGLGAKRGPRPLIPRAQGGGTAAQLPAAGVYTWHGHEVKPGHHTPTTPSRPPSDSLPRHSTCVSGLPSLTRPTSWPSPSTPLHSMAPY